MKYIIVTGNPVDGFTFMGPFGTRESAIEWTEDNSRDLSADWWIAALTAIE